MIESYYTALRADPEPELYVSATYRVNGKQQQTSATFHLADYAAAMVTQPPVVDALNEIGEIVGKISDTLRDISRHSDRLASNATDGTGLRLSQRTLNSLQQKDQLFDPMEFDRGGYQTILGITAEEAIQLHQVFHVIRSTPFPLRNSYEELPAQLREAFEKRFKVDLQ